MEDEGGKGCLGCISLIVGGVLVAGLIYWSIDAQTKELIEYGKAHPDKEKVIDVGCCPCDAGTK